MSIGQARQGSRGRSRSDSRQKREVMTPPITGAVAAVIDQRAKQEAEQATAALRVRRYALQRESARLLLNERRTKRDGTEANYRVTQCLWVARSFGGSQIAKTSQGATYRGLVVCGSLWH